MNHANNRALDNMARRVRSILMRGILQRVDDSKELQQMQVSRLEGEVLDECDRVGQWGFNSVPPAGAEVVIVQIGGNADHHVILGVDDSGRPRLGPGETAIYDAHGSKVHVANDGSVVIVASGYVNIVAGTVTVSGNLVIDGNVTIGGLLNGHTP